MAKTMLGILTFTYVCIIILYIWKFRSSSWIEQDYDPDLTIDVNGNKGTSVEVGLEEENIKAGEPQKNWFDMNSRHISDALAGIGFLGIIIAWGLELGNNVDPGYGKKLFRLVGIIFVLLGLVGVSMYFFTRTPWPLTIVVNLLNILIIIGAAGVAIELFRSPSGGPSGLPRPISLWKRILIYILLLTGTILSFVYTSVNFGWIVAILAIFAGLNVETKNAQRNSWQAFIGALLSYFPCLFVSLIDYIQTQLKITTPRIWLLLLAQLLLIGLRFLIPVLYSVYRKFFIPQGTILLENASPLNKPISLGIFQTPQEVYDKKISASRQFNYNYAISFWIWINPQSPSTNASYNTSTSLLNFGDVLNINFNKGTIDILAATTKGNTNSDLGEISWQQMVNIYTLRQIEFQRWNNFIINYSGGTLDIFVENKLVSSTPNITPIMSLNAITAGSINGIYGGIKNVIYFDRTLSLHEIKTISNDA